MSVVTEHMSLGTKSANYSQRALMIIDTYRKDIDEQFRIEPLEAEFPSYAKYLGANNVYLARAADNVANTFKVRGALVAMATLKQQGVERVSAGSAGNHAIGIAIAAKVLGMTATLVTPKSADPEKIQRLRELTKNTESRVILAGDNVDEAIDWARRHQEYGQLIHPFDDRNVGAGQGTIASDIVKLMPDVQHIVSPIGGGGLATGLKHALAGEGMGHVQIHAIEAPGSNSMSRSVNANKLTEAESPNQRYAGSAVKKIGGYAFHGWRNYDQPVRVSSQVTESDIDLLIDMYEQDRYDNWRTDTPAYEPTTLVAVAGLKYTLSKTSSDRVVVVGTGHNAPLHPNSRRPEQYLWRRQN